MRRQHLNTPVMAADCNKKFKYYCLWIKIHCQFSQMSPEHWKALI